VREKGKQGQKCPKTVSICSKNRQPDIIQAVAVNPPLKMAVFRDSHQM
jgi:hypothetical protein